VSEAAAAVSIHRADPGRRRLLLVLIPLGGGVLFALSRGFGFYLDHLPMDSTGQMRASGRAVLMAMDLCLYAAAVLLGALALYWHRVGRVMQAAPQYPLPQMRLFHDMRILSGAGKQARARRLHRGTLLAAAGAALALVLAVWMPRDEMRRHPMALDPSLPDHRFDESYPLKSARP
jgi:hypothetical protein